MSRRGMSRRGSVSRRCSTCGTGVVTGERICPAGHDRIAWSFTVDIAPPGAPRKQVRRSGFATKKEAVATLAQLQVEVESGDRVDPSKLTYGAYVKDRWFPAIEGNLRPSTLSSYRDVLRVYALPELGSIRLQALTPDLLNSLYGRLTATGGRAGQGLSRRTVRYVHTVIAKSLKDAERWRLVRRNVAALADPPTAKSTKPGRVKAWSAEEVRSFLDHVGDHRLRPLWWVLTTTGLRRGEALGLRWGNVDLEAGSASIVHTLISVNYEVLESTPKTDRGRRLVSLDPETVSVLRAWRKRQLEERVAWGPAWTDTGYVFTREDGTAWHPDRISHLFRQLVRQTDLPGISVHDLRHTSASLALAGGVPMKVVSDRLGHSSIAITADVYSHVSEGMDREAAIAIASAVSRR